MQMSNYQQQTTILERDLAYDFFKDQVKNEVDEKKLKTRIRCVKNWVEKYAEDQFKFRVKESKDEAQLSSLDEISKQALAKLKDAIKNTKTDEELEQAIFKIPKNLEMEMGKFFTLCYQIIIGKDKGPKLVAFVTEIGKEKILELL